MRVWFDDIRRPPSDDWEWMRTIDACKTLFETTEEEIDTISLDHDLGLESEDPDMVENYVGTPLAGTGYDLVCWMIDNGYVPRTVFIHTWNPVGALRMQTELLDRGYPCEVRKARASWQR